MPRKILIIEDNDMNREILKMILCDEYELLEAVNGLEGLEILKKDYDNISIVLLDIFMPIMDGYEFLTKVKKDNALSQVPVIAMTADNEQGSEVKILALGASDFIVKPYNPEVIKHRISNIITLRETAAIVNATKIDSLTEIYSRSEFFRIVEELVKQHEPGYYIMSSFNINGFKAINDQYGTKKGDEVLKFIAKTFESGFGALGGVCSRIADDNFGVLYPAEYIESDETKEIRIKSSTIPSLFSPITYSIGRYVISDKSLTASAMYDRAKMAELSIRGRYDVTIAYYDESMRANILLQQEITSEMDVALKQKEFEVWLQPQYDHTTGAMIGAEALVRWRHHKKGIIAPIIFIPIFERSGFIYELDKYVWKETCRLLRQWIDQGIQPLPVSVNISRYDILRHDLVERIIGYVREYDLPIELLRLEITESAFTNDTQIIVDVVKKLINFGFTVEIDDFGSGYSSLNTLKDVPAEIIKLDMRFFEATDNESRGGTIIESIVRMAHWIGMAVIAEGVETIEQADYLKSIGCRYIQGYLYAKPMMASEYEELLTKKAKQNKIVVLKTIQTLNNHAFWNPKSIETFIFNSFVGCAVVFEYNNNNKLEVLRVNDKYVDMFHHVRDARKNTNYINWLDYTDEKGKKQMLSIIKQAIKTSDEVSDEIKLVGISKPDAISYIKFSVRVIAYVGNRYLFYCKLDDMTEQREAELLAEKVSQQLQLIMENVNCGITAVIIDGEKINFIFANPKYYDILGYTPEQYKEEIKGTFNDIYPEDKPLLMQAIKQVSETGVPRTIDYRVIRRDKKVIWVSNATSSTNFIGYSSTIMLSMLTDITEKKLNEQQMHFLNASMKELMNDTPGGFTRLQYLPDRKIKAVYVNKGFCDLLGLEAEEIIANYDKKAFWNVHPEDVPKVRDKLSILVKSPETQNLKYRVRYKDGSYKLCLVFCRSITNDNGEIYLNMYYSDISELNKLEDRQKELLDNLPCGATIHEMNSKGELRADYYNKRYLELTEQTAEEVRTPMEDVYYEDRPILKQAILEAIKADRKFECDARIVNNKGEYKAFHLTGTVADKGNGSAMLYTTYLPIMESEISYTNMLLSVLEAMLSSATNLCFVKDKDLKYIYCSKPFAKMVGLENQQDVFGKTDYDFFDENLANKYRDDDHKLIETGQSLVDYIEVIPSSDDIIHYSNTTKHLLKDAMGNIVGIYGFGSDITETRNAHKRLELLTSSMHGCFAVFEINNEGGIRQLYYDKGIYELVDYPKEDFDIIGKDDFFEIIHEGDVDKLHKTAEAILNKQEDIDLIFRIYTYNHEIKWINLRGIVTDRYENKVIVNAVLLDCTQRKKFESNLDTIHKAIELASYNSGFTFWIYDINNRILRHDVFNSPSLLGYGKIVENVPESLLHNGTIHPDDEAKLIKMYDELFAGKSTCECTIRTKNLNTSEYEWQQIIYHRLGDELFNKPAAIGFARNADLIKGNEHRYQHELQLRKELMRDSIYYYQMNVTTKVIEEYYSKYNDVEGMAGNTKISDQLRENVLKLAKPEYREDLSKIVFPENLLEIYKQGQVSNKFLYQRYLKDAGFRWVEVNVSILEQPYSNDIIAFIYAVDVDINQKNKLAIETIMDEEIEALIIVDVQSWQARFVKRIDNIVSQNDSFDYEKRVLQYLKNNVIEEDIDECKKFLNKNEMLDKLVYEDNVKVTFRIRENNTICRKNVRAFYLDETHQDIVIIYRDVTEIYAKEEQKQQALQVAMDKANDANKAKSAFLSNVSHDMRTPLNAILTLSSEQMMYNKNQYDLQDHLTKIHKSGHYLLNIINNILDMSKIEHKKMILNPEPYAITEFIDIIDVMIGERCRDKGIEFNIIVEKQNLSDINADKFRLNQIFIKLLSNSVKFTPKGGKIDLVIQELPSDDEKITQKRFMVIDNGIGMSAEFLPSAFDDFAQEYHKGLSETHQGVGLGLPIAKGIVELMGGTIKVKSDVGKGTTFTIDIPFEIASAVTRTKDTQDIDLYNLEGLKILLCEDNPLNMEIAKNLLEMQGCIVDCAENGQEAVDIYLRKKEVYYDVIIMDIRMPVMDGIEASKIIRSCNRLDSLTIPIIAMTANACSEEDDAILKTIMSERLAKPIDTELLYKSLKKLTKRN